MFGGDAGLRRIGSRVDRFDRARRITFALGENSSCSKVVEKRENCELHDQSVSDVSEALCG